MTSVVSKRALIAGAVSALLAGCVTVERPIPLATVAEWRIADVVVEFAPTGALNIDNFATAISLRKMGTPNLGTGVADIGIDPAGGGRNLQQERIIELNATPEVKEQARADAAKVIAERFRAAFANQPSGKVPVRMRVIVGNAQSQADAALLVASAVFEEMAGGKVLLRSEAFAHNRPSRQAAMFGTLIGGGLLAAATIAAVGAMQDSGRQEPFVDVCDTTAGRLKEWLLKP